jgi:two-component system sensor histidine kinase VanS
MINPFISVWKRSITYKIFLVTLILLVVSAVFIYTALYFYLPSFYEKNKLNQLDAKVEQLAHDLEHLSLDEAKTLIDELASQTNSLVLLNDSTDQVVYMSSMFSTPSDRISSEISMKLDSSEPKREIQRGFLSNDKSPIGNTESLGQSIGSYMRKIPISLANQDMTLTINATLQPINEASRVLALFIPNIAMFTLVISIIGAYIYSRIISRPLINLNQAAKKMSNLEFEHVIQYPASDEIGQLSSSLNDMSANLQQTMNDLHNSNEQLKLELIKEREIEDQRRRLFAMISHELKSPLTAVKGQLEGMIHGFGPYGRYSFN